MSVLPAPALSRREKIQFLFLSLATHSCWGLYHPISRYLQVVDGLGFLYVLGFVQLLAMIVNKTEQMVRGGSEDNKPSLSSSDADSVVSAAAHRRRLAGYSYGILACTRAIFNIWSTALTVSFYTQAVAALNPFVVALLSKVLMGEKVLPPWFTGAFLLCLLGTGLVIMGESIEQAWARASSGAAEGAEGAPGSGGAKHSAFFANLSFSLIDLAGCAMQFLSVCLSGCMRVQMKWTKDVGIGKSELADYQYRSNLAMVVVFTLSLELFLPKSWGGGGGAFSGWATFQHLSATSWFYLVVFGVVIFWWANVAQISAVRTLGPTLYSSLQPLRVLWSLLGSYLIMGEPVKSGWSWLGLVVLITTLVAYFRRQMRGPEAGGASELPVVLPEKQEGRANGGVGTRHMAGTLGKGEGDVVLGEEEGVEMRPEDKVRLSPGLYPEEWELDQHNKRSNWGELPTTDNVEERKIGPGKKKGKIVSRHSAE